MIANANKNIKPSRTKSTTHPEHQNLTNTLEKTTEGILKAARLGDLKMLSDLHREGIIFLVTYASSVYANIVGDKTQVN